MLNPGATWHRAKKEMGNQIKTVLLKFEVNMPMAVAELIEHQTIQEEISGLNLIAAQHKEKRTEKNILTNCFSTFDKVRKC